MLHSALQMVHAASALQILYPACQMQNLALQVIHVNLQMLNHALQMLQPILKFRIRETMNLSACANGSTDTKGQK